MSSPLNALVILSVVALATAARAAGELTEATGIEATTIAKFLYENTATRRAERAQQREAAQAMRGSLRPSQRLKANRELARLEMVESSFTLRAGQLLVIDEASMTGTFDLAQVARLAEHAGAKMLLVGDHAQLDSPSAGGFLGWMDRTQQTQHLTSVWRFHADWEKAASLRLRDGDPSVFAEPDPKSKDPLHGAYFSQDRVREGLDEQVLEDSYNRVQEVIAEGGSAILIAATNDQVEDLNTRATLDRRAAGVVSTARTVDMRVGLSAGLGDVVLLRKTDNHLKDVKGQAVANGDLIVIDAIHPGGLVMAHRQTIDGKRGAHLELTASWLAKNAELGYATTAHRAQGVTVDEGHLVMTSGARLTRELLYVAISRGRSNNTAWVGVMDEATAKDSHLRVTDIPTARDVLNRCLAAVGAELTANEAAEAEHHRRHSLQRLIAEHDYLGAIAGGQALTTELTTLLGHEAAKEISNSHSYDALVATWQRAMDTNPHRTRWLLSMAIQPEEAPENLGATTVGQAEFDLASLAPNAASILHQWLDRGVLATVEATTITPPEDLHALVATVPDVDAGITDLVGQCETLMAERITSLRERLATSAAPPPLLPPAPAADDPARALWDAAALAAAIYADTWGESVLASAGDDERRARHQARTRAHLQNWTTPPTPKVIHVEVDPHADPDREWEESVPEAWSHELAAAIDPDVSIAVEVPDSESPQPPPAPLTPFTMREHTDYEDRLTRALEAAFTLWQKEAATSWTPDYLAGRGLTNLEAGYAPGGRGRYTYTLDALRHQGFTTGELTDAGLIRMNEREQFVDRFRDRLALPVRDGRGRLLGFTARKNPADDGPAPKYLNTATTDLFAKSDLLYGLTPEAITRLNAGAIPVLGEGAFDAEAITSLDSQWIGLATCGTALTTAHLAALEAVAPGSVNRIVTAFDPDAAGRKATARTWELLPDEATRHVKAAPLPHGCDPAQLVQDGDSTLLAAVLQAASPIRTELIHQALATQELSRIEQALSLARHVCQFAARDGALSDPKVAGEVMTLLAQQLVYTDTPHTLDPVTLADLLLTARDRHSNPTGEADQTFHVDAEHLATTYPLAAAGITL